MRSNTVRALLAEVYLKGVHRHSGEKENEIEHCEGDQQPVERVPAKLEKGRNHFRLENRKKIHQIFSNKY